ncbi:MAG: oligosaccharide flippase family protein [Candidatus Omnitrophota bacterium]
MLKKFKALDLFTKNIIVVFFSSFLCSFLNLACQLLVAHKLIPSDFAAYNSLISIYSLLATPLVTLQTALAKYIAEFKINNELGRVSGLLSGFLKKAIAFSVFVFVALCFIFSLLMPGLKINSLSSGYILAGMLAAALFTPIFLGGIQGMELFGWLSTSTVLSGFVKLALTYFFIFWGYSINGALGAFLAAAICSAAVSYLPLKKYISFKKVAFRPDYREIFIYLWPVAISIFCFTVLITSDMILVRYFFDTIDSGVYALAQMAGKIFLFLPGAISVVLLPKTSGLSAKKMNTVPVLMQSIRYGFILCLAAVAAYNLFPVFVLKVLTGKALTESIFLGRLFSVSMSFFALLFILITYFLSIKDLRFIKYLVVFTFLEIGAITLFHQSLVVVQVILCLSAIALFAIHLKLAFDEKH